MARICPVKTDAVGNPRMRDLPIVYVVATAKLEYIKIGRTLNIKQRLHNLQSGCPFPIHVWAGIRTKTPEKIEQYIHAVLQEYCLRGEWFALPPNRLDWLLAYCAAKNKATRGAL